MSPRYCTPDPRRGEQPPQLFDPQQLLILVLPQDTQPGRRLASALPKGPPCAVRPTGAAITTGMRSAWCTTEPSRTRPRAPGVHTAERRPRDGCAAPSSPPRPADGSSEPTHIAGRPGLAATVRRDPALRLDHWPAGGSFRSMIWGRVLLDMQRHRDSVSTWLSPNDATMWRQYAGRPDLIWFH